MEAKVIAEKIVNLKNKDETLRNELISKGELSNGYNKEMEALHNSNAKELSQIIDSIGYPTTEKVGKKASDAAWLIIQHSISQPNFMKKCVTQLANAVDQNKANPINLAYLSDRIAVFEGKVQLYGTQFDWNKNSELSPNLYDDLKKVNHRRTSIGLNTLEEQIQIMRKRVEDEKQFPPENLEERQREYNEWKKSRLD